MKIIRKGNLIFFFYSSYNAQKANLKNCEMNEMNEIALYIFQDCERIHCMLNFIYLEICYFCLFNFMKPYIMYDWYWLARAKTKLLH